VSTGPYNIEWAPRAAAEFDQLRAFEAKAIHRAIEWLAYQAETRTRNRKPLGEPLEDLPEASWELRIRAYRVFYEVRPGGASASMNPKTVRILRVILKGRQSTREAVSRKP
jgi:mRNA-degrading endonuclease RelE of RelBE toxin-antitoxin system